MIQVDGINITLGDMSSLYPGWVCMSLLSEDGVLVSGLSSCKEYALDHTLATIKTSPYRYNSNKVYLEEARLVVSGLGQRVANSLAAVNLMETVLSIPLSVVLPVQGEIVLFRGHKTWFISPPMVSLYTLMVRNGRYYELGWTLEQFFDFMVDGKINGQKDTALFQQAIKGIRCILAHGWQAVFGADLKANWPNGTDIHGRGICAFGLGTLSSQHPDWYKLYK